jgi:hypothetical protein
LRPRTGTPGQGSARIGTARAGRGAFFGYQPETAGLNSQVAKPLRCQWAEGSTFARPSHEPEVGPFGLDRDGDGEGCDAPVRAPPPPDPGPGTDPRFDTCGEAIAAGYGPYHRGQDPEYDWYRDADGDGVVCG